MIRFFTLLVCVTVFFACPAPDDNFDEFICYGFDERQCKGDSFLSETDSDSSLDDKLELVRDYLESKNITVDDIRYEENFHEFVCQACTICPELHRYFVRIAADNDMLITNLELLNLEEVRCIDVF